MFSYWLLGSGNSSISLWLRDVKARCSSLSKCIDCFELHRDGRKPKSSQYDRKRLLTISVMQCDMWRGATSAATTCTSKTEWWAGGRREAGDEGTRGVSRSSRYEEYNNQYLASGIKTFQPLFATRVNILYFIRCFALSLSRLHVLVQGADDGARPRQRRWQWWWRRWKKVVGCDGSQR